tara:strand:+ start:723 stop:1196 length:474 start_codon:yes stop_codon:yes gene_type:complete
MSRKSSFAASTLTVTLKESLTLDGRDYGGVQSYSFSGIGNVTRRIETITTAESSIATFDTVIGPGQYVPANVRYMRFSNLDDTNHIVLTFANENNNETAIKLDAGQSLVWNGDNSGGMADVMDADSSALTVSLGDMKSITADADTASCDMEIFIASV